MPRFLLSWHGTFLCHDSTRIFPASLEEVDAGRITPILMDPGSYLLLGPSSLSVYPDITSDFPGAVALRSGQTYLTVTSEGNVEKSETCDQQALFLPLPKDILPLLKVLTSRDWVDGNGHVARGQLKELSLVLGETRLDPCGLERGPEGTILHRVSGTVLHPWPNDNMEPALAAVRSAFEAGAPGKHAIWAQWSELEGQIALVHAHPDHPPHLYYLARLCTLLGLFDEANLCLDALKGAISDVEHLVVRSIVASCAGDDIVSALLLSQAFRLATASRLEPAEIKDHSIRIRMGEFTHKRVLNEMRFLHQVAINDAFDIALMPCKLPADTDHASRLYYYQELEQAWNRCPRSGRIAFIEREEQLNGASHALHLIKAHNYWLNRDVANANIHYEKARSLAISNGYGFVHFNCGAYSWLTGMPRPPERHPLSVAHWEWHWAPAPQTTPEVCLVLGCDATYFNFFPKLLASLIQAAETTPPSATIRLVLGVATPREEQITFLKACSRALAEKNHPVQLSFAWGTLSHPDGASYTCIRYMLLPEITKQYSCPIITLDIDAMIPRDFTNLVRTLKADYDYGFRLYAFDREGHQLAGEPWGFGATVSYFGETDQLPLLAQELHDYVVTAYNSANPTNWCVDQCGLSAVYHRHIAPRWNVLRIRFMDDDPAIVAMPHHYGMDKDSFRAWDGIVDIVPVYTSLGIDPEIARHLGR